MRKDLTIQIAVAKGIGSAIVYVGALVALMYPVALAAGYLG